MDQPLPLGTIYLTFCWNYAKIYLYFWKSKKLKLKKVVPKNEKEKKLSYKLMSNTHYGGKKTPRKGCQVPENNWCQTICAIPI